MQKGENTRSGLLWEVERLLNEMTELPQVLLMENVPEVIGTKNMPHFAEWIEALEKMGYKNYWQNLKATDYGIPQSRNRTFMVSLLGDYYYSFPKAFKLEYLLKDFLETEVDEKYYLSDKMINFFKNNEQKMKEKGNGFRFNVSDGNVVGKTITTNAGNRMDDNFIKLNQVGELDIKGNDSIKRVYSPNGLSPTLTTMEGGNRQPKIQEADNYSKSKHSLDARCDYLGVAVPQVIGGVGEKKSNNGTQHYQQDRIYKDDIALTVSTCANPYYKNDLRIRKLTPKECWRLMGFDDELFQKAQSVNSNAQLYKQAGNSIVVTVLMAIFGELLGVDWKSKVENLVDKLKEKLNEI